MIRVTLPEQIRTEVTSAIPLCFSSSSFPTSCTLFLPVHSLVHSFLFFNFLGSLSRLSQACFEIADQSITSVIVCNGCFSIWLIHFGNEECSLITAHFVSSWVTGVWIGEHCGVPGHHFQYTQRGTKRGTYCCPDRAQRIKWLKSSWYRRERQNHWLIDSDVVLADGSCFDLGQHKLHNLHARKLDE